MDREKEDTPYTSTVSVKRTGILRFSLPSEKAMATHSSILA